MDANPKRLTGSPLTEFLGTLGIAKIEPVSRPSDSGERADEDQLRELLKKGDPLRPCPGRFAEDAARSLLELLYDYRDYRQFQDAKGEWDRPSLRSTLLAMFLAARYLLMHEDEVRHAQTTVQHLQPDRVETPLDPEDFHPGESFATYFGRKADENKRLADEYGRKADENKRLADEYGRKADDAIQRLRQKDADLRKAEDERRKAEVELRKKDEDLRKSEDSTRKMVVRLRQRGYSEAEIAEDLNCTVEQLQQRFPPQP